MATAEDRAICARVRGINPDSLVAKPGAKGLQLSDGQDIAVGAPDSCTDLGGTLQIHAVPCKLAIRSRRRMNRPYVKALGRVLDCQVNTKPGMAGYTQELMNSAVKALSYNAPSLNYRVSQWRKTVAGAGH